LVSILPWDAITICTVSNSNITHLSKLTYKYLFFSLLKKPDEL